MTFKTFKTFKRNILQDPRSSKIIFEQDGRYHYVYRIYDYEDNQYYYGSRSSKKHPNKDMFITYFTSSKKKDLIKESSDRFSYKIIKIFKNPGDKIIYESYLHNKFDVKVNNKFWNSSNQTAFGFDTTGITPKHTKTKKHAKMVSKIHKGVPKSEETKKKISNTLQGHTPWNKGKTGLQEAWNKGLKTGSVEKVECPWCGSFKDPGNAKQSCFDYCKENPNRKKQIKTKRIIGIFNPEGELVYQSEGSFKTWLPENNLPRSFIKSLKEGGSPLFQTNASLGAAKANGSDIYKDWYAKEL